MARPVKGACRPAFLLRPAGRAAWTLELRRSLPAGRYLVAAWARDAAGAPARFTGRPIARRVR